MKVLLLALALAAGSCAHSQYLSNELSFGHNGRLSGASHNDEIPNFKVIGDPREPQILSNKVILTPPAPGNQRGAVWAKNALQHTEWTADVDFRVSGPERGGGNLQVWLTKNGEHDVGTASIYTVGKFEGLVLVMDTHGGTGGMVRGFLNDGSTAYKDHHSVDSLAFGNCAYSYRNLGRPSQVKLRQSTSTFKVEVDGKVCFESSKIRLPVGYHFGVSAASAQDPDSFEVFKFVVMTDTYAAGQAAPGDNHPPPGQQMQQPPTSNTQNTFAGSGGQSSYTDDPKDISADQINQAGQFADLHNRLQANFKHISTFQRDFNQFSGKTDGQMGGLSGQISALASRLDKIEQSLESISRHVSDKDYVRLHNELKQTVEQNHGHLADSLSASVGILAGAAPSLGKFLFIVLGFQAAIVVAYVVYKRRRSSSGKKYL